MAMSVAPVTRPLSEKPLGYMLAVLGGFLGGPVGIFVSPGVLFLLNKILKAEAEKKPNRFLAWALIGIIGAPLSLVPVIISNSTNTTSGGSQTEAAAPSASQQSVPLGTEEQVKGDRSMKITASEVVSSLPSGNQFQEPLEAKGGKLVVVYVTIKNTGSESGNMFWSQFQLVDSEGKKYDDIEDFTEMVTVNMWAKNNGLAETGDQLFPGGTANSALVFRVAPNATGLRLLVNDDKLFNIE
jgi:hypothetical protein